MKLTLAQVEAEFEQVRAKHGSIKLALDSEQRPYVMKLLDALRAQAEEAYGPVLQQPRPTAVEAAPRPPRVDEQALGPGTRQVVDLLDPYRSVIDRLSLLQLAQGEGGDGALFALYVSNLRRLAERENQDACIGISGYEGSGKSTFALKLAQWLQPGFTAEQVCFDAESLLERIKTAPRRSVVMLDEAVNGLYAREAMAMDNRVLTTAAMVARARNLYWILCIPHLHNLDPYFREHRVRSWWHVLQKGEALGHVAKRSPYYPDTYWDPFMRFQYSRVSGALWDAYDEFKQRYILDKLEDDSTRASDHREKKGRRSSKKE